MLNWLPLDHLSQVLLATSRRANPAMCLIADITNV